MQHPWNCVPLLVMIQFTLLVFVCLYLDSKVLIDEGDGAENMFVRIGNPRGPFLNRITVGYPVVFMVLSYPVHLKLSEERKKMNAIVLMQTTNSFLIPRQAVCGKVCYKLCLTFLLYGWQELFYSELCEKARYCAIHKAWNGFLSHTHKTGESCTWMNGLQACVTVYRDFPEDFFRPLRSRSNRESK